MFRFTIRDLLWLMVVVGMACGWWADRSRLRQPLTITGRTLDFAIDGEGYFNLIDHDDLSLVCTRCGRFSLDHNGQIVAVLGDKEWPLNPPIQVPEDAVSWMVNTDGLVVAQMPSTIRPSSHHPDSRISEFHFAAMGQLQLSLFDKPSALREVVPLVYAPTIESGNPEIVHPGQGGAGMVRQGILDRALKPQ